jgi:hypothetical protein
MDKSVTLKTPAKRVNQVLRDSGSRSGRMGGDMGCWRMKLSSPASAVHGA